MVRESIVYLFGLVVLAACGGESTRARYEIPEELVLDRQTLLREMPVTNANGVEGGVQVGAIGYPLAVVVAIIPGSRGGSSVGLCSAAHFARGKVSTNAHCVVDEPTLGTQAKPLALSDINFIYYDRDNQRRVINPTATSYLGSVPNDDVAIFEIDAADADEWSHFEGTVANTSLDGRTTPPGDAVNANDPQVHEITVWSFDPTEGVATGSVPVGMQFHARQCVGSRTEFEIREKNSLGNWVPLRTSAYTSAYHLQLDARKHLFVDGCDVTPIRGNSGSLMTLRDNPQQLVGAFHWNFSFRTILRTTVSIKGNRNYSVPREVSGFLFDLFQVGTAFDYIERMQPAALLPLP